MAPEHTSRLFCSGTGPRITALDFGVAASSKALGVQLFREDREQEGWFTTISYWSDLESMTAFTKGEPTKVHHPDLLIELPESIQIHRIVIDRQGLR
jgi:hypothetical protein